MSQNVVAIGPDAEFREAADTMEKRGVKRLPVLDDGRLLGIFTRYDLVRALTQVNIVKSSGRLDDRAVYKAVNERIQSHGWLSGTLINVAVDNGVVQFSGFVHSTDQRHPQLDSGPSVAGDTEVIQSTVTRGSSALRSAVGSAP